MCQYREQAMTSELSSLRINRILHHVEDALAKCGGLFAYPLLALDIAHHWLSSPAGKKTHFTLLKSGRRAKVVGMLACLTSDEGHDNGTSLVFIKVSDKFIVIFQLHSRLGDGDEFVTRNRNELVLLVARGFASPS